MSARPRRWRCCDEGVAIRPARRTRNARADRCTHAQPGKGELRVGVLACAINYPDVLIIEDKYQFKPPRPFAPGAEISGEVEAIGDDVKDWTVGDRLIAVVPHGGLAEQMIVPAQAAIRMPKDANPIEGAALIFT